MAYIPPNTNGQKTMANSAPVVIASDNTVDMAGNDNIVIGSLTAADIVSTPASGQGGQSIITGTPTAGSTTVLTFPTINGSPESQSNVVISITGTFVGTYVFERSPDGGTTWTSVNLFIAGMRDAVSGGTLIGMFHGNVAGTTGIRVRCTSFTSGTIGVRINSGIGTGTITVGNPIRLYDATNKIEGTIKPASTAAAATDTAVVVAVSPNNTVPVSLATNTPTIAAGSAIIGKVGIDQTTAGTTNAVSLAQLGTTTIATGNGVAGAGVQRVTIASDNTSNTNPFLVAQQTAASSAITSVTGATTSTTVLAANTNRKGAYFYNDSTAVLYLAYAATASTTAYTVQIPAGGFYEMPYKPLYTGLITGIWSAANGAVRVTELS